MQLLLVYCLVNFFASVTGRIAPGPEPRQDLTFVNSSSKLLIDTADPPLGVGGNPSSPDDPSSPDADAVWHKAYCRGAALIRAMSLEEEESTAMLEWPYTESPWDGDLEPELRKWGYLDDNDRHAEVVESCDFAGLEYQMKKAFNALGVNPRSAKRGGPNHCFYLKHGFGPTVILDKNGKMPPLSEQRYEADEKIYRVTGAYSKIGINRDDGIVYFLNRQSPEKAAENLWGLKQDQIDKAELPKLRASSDLAWGLWNRFQGEPKIKMIMSLEIINDDTRGVIIPKALEAMGELELRKWPGTDFTVRSSDEAQAEAALALIGSPNGLGAGYFLLQHKRQLGGPKFISKIKVFQGGENFYGEASIIFYVDKHKPPMPDPDDIPGSPIEEGKVVRRSMEGKDLVRVHKIRVKL